MFQGQKPQTNQLFLASHPLTKNVFKKGKSDPKQKNKKANPVYNPLRCEKVFFASTRDQKCTTMRNPKSQPILGVKPNHHNHHFHFHRQTKPVYDEMIWMSTATKKSAHSKKHQKHTQTTTTHILTL